MAIRYSGGYCAGVLPLPIPNREVKPGCADGTAMQCGRVGGRLLLEVKLVFLLDEVTQAFFIVVVYCSLPFELFFSLFTCLVLEIL